MQAKTLSKLVNVDVVEKMLQHLEGHKFIKILSNKDIQFGLLSENIKEFVKKEWLQSNVVTPDWPAFLCNGLNTNENLKTIFEDVKTLVSIVPFSMVQINDFRNTEQCISLPETTSAVQLVSNQFKKPIGTVLKSQIFCAPENALDIFHKKQRESKNWWRKFSALPGRFVTCNVNQKENDKSLVCEIQAEFPWGLETVETIKYLRDFASAENSLPEVYISKRKKCVPHIISSVTGLEKMTFTYLCDAYERLNEESDRDVLMFAKKLAPFKVALAGNGSSSETVKNLQEVSLLIAKQVRKLGISVLFLPDACTTSVEKQILRNDAIGVPYTLLFDDDSLKVGTVKLRSRDTTIKEDSHVSLIAEYLGKLL